MYVYDAEIGPIAVHFEIPMFNPSGLQVHHPTHYHTQHTHNIINAQSNHVNDVIVCAMHCVRLGSLPAHHAVEGLQAVQVGALRHQVTLIRVQTVSTIHTRAYLYTHQQLRIQATTPSSIKKHILIFAVRFCFSMISKQGQQY